MTSIALIQNTPATMSSREIAELTGKDHKNVIRDIRTMLEELDAEDGSVLSHVQEDKDARGYTAAFHLSREMTDTLLTGYSTPLRRKVIARWHELEQSHLKPQYQPLTQAEQDIRVAMLLAEALNVSPSGRVNMLSVALKHSAPHMLPALPSYAVDAPSDVLVSGSGSAMPTASATDLLKRHNVKMSTARFNEALKSKGFLHQGQRTSSRGDLKHYWCVTVQGEKYGKNLVSTQNTRETQPHWYVDRFGALLKAVGVGE